MKIVGIAQRITRRATSVGGIVLVEGEQELALVLGQVYGAMHLPFRPEAVGSLRRAGSQAGTKDAIKAFATEAERIYAAVHTPIDETTLKLSSNEGKRQSLPPRPS
jgi:hypothetical protein